MMENFPSFVDYILVALFGIVIPFVSGVKSSTAFKNLAVPFDFYSRRRFYIGNSLFLFLMAAIIIIVWWLYSRPFDVLGFTRPSSIGKSIPWWMIALFLFMYLFDMFYSLFEKNEREDTIEKLHDQTPFMPTEIRDLPAYTVMCISAGVFEEIVFRGYLINFFQYVFASVPAGAAWAVITPAIIFSIAHFYQGPGAVFKILVLSLLFGMIFWHSGSLYAVILLHFFVDFISGLLSIYLAKQKK
ncbi:MAG: CPBP family intramembrane metalloprotease [Chitinophagaceae bacterium]|nr:CPBP family intramembrane metalloprotease [Chitinophagaceae bacterium]